MRAYTYTIHVDRPQTAVWSFLTDLTQAPRWRTMFKSMAVVGDGPIRPGTKIQVVMEAYGKVQERVITTTIFDAPRRWVTRSASNNIEGSFEYLVEPEANGCRVTASCDLTARGLLPSLFLPIIARQERRHRRSQLDAFKSAAERSVPV